MAQEMGALESRIETRLRQSAAHDGPDRLAVGEATAWSPHADKDLPRRTWRSAVTKVDGQGLADLLRQWEPIMAGAFPPEQEFPLFPIEIIESQGGPFTRPQTESGQ